jgi:hypothetical protein
MEGDVDAIVDGNVFRRCGCRNRASGRQLTSRCPLLTDHGHGRWYFAAQVSGVDGRRTRVRRGGFASLAHAERARLNFLALPDIATAGRNWTMRRWLEHWLSSMQEQVRPSTMRSYREHVRRYLIPHLGLDVPHRSRVAAAFTELALAI